MQTVGENAIEARKGAASVFTLLLRWRDRHTGAPGPELSIDSEIESKERERSEI